MINIDYYPQETLVKTLNDAAKIIKDSGSDPMVIKNILKTKIL